jgi:hypothetical protein
VDKPPVAPARKRRAWAPDHNDRWVYEMVKFDGLSQLEAADRARINQSTVSRIIQRYERWQAHAEDRDDGELDPAERWRAQRRLTYERNERMLASALRLAKEMEGYKELHKSVRDRPTDPYTAGTDRTESAMIDRSGLAARFLRLAFRIGKEQMALVSQEAPPRPEPPLSETEHCEQEENASAARAEFQMVRDFKEADDRAYEQSVRDAQQATETEGRKDGEMEGQRDDQTRRLGDEETAGVDAGANRRDHAAREGELNLHKLHSCIAAESIASAGAAGGCNQNAAREKLPLEACIDVKSGCERSPQPPMRAGEKSEFGTVLCVPVSSPIKASPNPEEERRVLDDLGSAYQLGMTREFADNELADYRKDLSRRHRHWSYSPAQQAALEAWARLRGEPTPIGNLPSNVRY